MTEHKTFSFTEFKSTDESGNFKGVLSTYGNEDLVGDVCDPGCFDNSVKARGDKFPFLWQHMYFEPIGSFVVTDTKGNLSIDGHFNLDVQRGREAFSLLKAGDVNGLSIGFRLMDADYVDGVRHLKDVDLVEGSFVTFPANPEAFAEAKQMNDQMKGTLRKQISATDGFKSLDPELQKRLMKAVDEALTEDEGHENSDKKKEDAEENDNTDQDEAAGDNESNTDEESHADENEDPDEEEEDMKAILDSISDLKKNTECLTKSMKEVIS